MNVISILWWKFCRFFGITKKDEDIVVSPPKKNRYIIEDYTTTYNTKLYIFDRHGNQKVHEHYYDTRNESDNPIFSFKEINDSEPEAFEAHVKEAHARLQLVVDDLNNETHRYESFKEKDNRAKQTKQEAVDRILKGDNL